MLRMDAFDVVVAESYAHARSLWGPDAMYVAGGTDLLPNIKHGLFRPKRVIHLGCIKGSVHVSEGELVIGAGITLAELADDTLIQAHLPMLAEAARLVAGPQIRNAGTLGGNILLDTRCLFYNQTEFWRKSLGHCLKAEGTWCHVVGGPKTCVATQSSDTVPVLLATNAKITLLGESGARQVGMRDLYQYNGMDHLKINKGELLTEVRIPLKNYRGSYKKLRTRASIDFPQLGIALVAEKTGSVIDSLEIVVGAASPQPKPIRGLDAYVGKTLDAASMAEIGDLVYKQTRPQGSVHGDTAWRRQMAVILTKRALEELCAY